MAWKHKSYMNSSFVVGNTLRLRYQDQPVSVVARFGHWWLRESDKGKGKCNVYPRTGHEDPDGEWRYSYTLSLPSALDRVGGQLHAPAALLPKKIHCQLYRKLGRPQGQSGRERKILPPLGFDLRTVEPVASR